MKRQGDLLDPTHLSQWQEVYDDALSRYSHGHLTKFEAFQILRELGYRSEAQKIEIEMWERERAFQLGTILVTTSS